jgi:hypothetical protein
MVGFVVKKELPTNLGAAGPLANPPAVPCGEWDTGDFPRATCGMDLKYLYSPRTECRDEPVKP